MWRYYREWTGSVSFVIFLANRMRMGNHSKLPDREQITKWDAGKLRLNWMSAFCQAEKWHDEAVQARGSWSLHLWPPGGHTDKVEGSVALNTGLIWVNLHLLWGHLGCHSVFTFCVSQIMSAFLGKCGKTHKPVFRHGIGNIGGYICL